MRLLDPSRRRRLFCCLLTLLLAIEVSAQAPAGSTTTIQDVIYRAELKTNMRWLIGNGNPGRLQELEARVEHHEAVLQRSLGIGAAAGIFFALIHLAVDCYLRVHHLH